MNAIMYVEGNSKRIMLKYPNAKIYFKIIYFTKRISYYNAISIISSAKIHCFS